MLFLCFPQTFCCWYRYIAIYPSSRIPSTTKFRTFSKRDRQAPQMENSRKRLIVPEQCTAVSSHVPGNQLLERAQRGPKRCKTVLRYVSGHQLLERAQIGPKHLCACITTHMFPAIICIENVKKACRHPYGQ